MAAAAPPPPAQPLLIQRNGDNFQFGVNRLSLQYAYALIAKGHNITVLCKNGGQKVGLVFQLADPFERNQCIQEILKNPKIGALIGKITNTDTFVRPQGTAGLKIDFTSPEDAATFAESLAPQFFPSEHYATTLVGGSVKIDSKIKETVDCQIVRIKDVFNRFNRQTYQWDLHRSTKRAVFQENKPKEEANLENVENTVVIQPDQVLQEEALKLLAQPPFSRVENTLYIWNHKIPLTHLQELSLDSRPSCFDIDIQKWTVSLFFDSPPITLHFEFPTEEERNAFRKLFNKPEVRANMRGRPAFDPAMQIYHFSSSVDRTIKSLPSPFSGFKTVDFDPKIFENTSRIDTLLSFVSDILKPLYAGLKIRQDDAPDETTAFEKALYSVRELEPHLEAITGKKAIFIGRKHWFGAPDRVDPEFIFGKHSVRLESATTMQVDLEKRTISVQTKERTYHFHPRTWGELDRCVEHLMRTPDFSTQIKPTNFISKIRIDNVYGKLQFSLNFPTNEHRELFAKHFAPLIFPNAEYSTQTSDRSLTLQLKASVPEDKKDEVVKSILDRMEEKMVPSACEITPQNYQRIVPPMPSIAIPKCNSPRAAFHNLHIGPAHVGIQLLPPIGDCIVWKTVDQGTLNDWTSFASPDRQDSKFDHLREYVSFVRGAYLKAPDKEAFMQKLLDIPELLVDNHLNFITAV